MKKILVVEDEQALRLGLEENLSFEGYEVASAKDGPGGLQAALSTRFDLILLDLMLPGMSGYEVARRLREQGRNVPIVMLTARTDEFDKLHGFESGADDYVTKPFSVKELLARIRAVLARGPRQEQTAAGVTFGPFRLDPEARTLTQPAAGKDIELTRTEFDLLAFFCRHQGEALSRDRLMNEVWGTEYYGTQRSVDSFVASLRNKLENRKYHWIQTVHGIGYKFVAEDTGA